VVAVNKMDMVGYEQSTFDRIQAEFSAFLEGVGVRDAYFLPMSALAGDNVVRRSGNMPWFHGPSLLDHLESVDASSYSEGTGFRMPVQCVIRPNQHFRGYAGQIAGGSIRPGDEVVVLPAGLRSRVRRIATFDGDLKEAFAPMAVTLELEDHLDISRGDLLCAASAKPHATRRLEAQVVWMDTRPLDPRRKYLIKHTSQTVAAEVTAIHHRVDVNTLQKQATESLEMNAIGLVEILTAKALFFDAYSINRTTGSFILIDPETNATSGAGMIVRPVTELRSVGPVTARERRARWGHRGAVIRVATRAIADSLERALFERGCAVAVVENEDLAGSLESAGMLAVLVSPWSNAEAEAHTILHELEHSNVLRPREVIRDGGGI
jgi:sulfate adenylyltransferase subunit 1